MASILIADDSLLIRETLKAILTEAGHQVIAEAGNGYEACIEYEKHQPDLVTMDINMPYMSGIEALSSIMSKFPQAKIIMVSNESSSNLICQCMHLGAKGYVIKPFHIQGFVDTVNKLLQCGNSISIHGLQGIYNRISAL